MSEYNQIGGLKADSNSVMQINKVQKIVSQNTMIQQGKTPTHGEGEASLGTQ